MMPPLWQKSSHRNARWLGEESNASLILLRGTPLMAMPWAVVSWAMK